MHVESTDESEIEFIKHVLRVMAAGGPHELNGRDYIEPLRRIVEFAEHRGYEKWQ